MGKEIIKEMDKHLYGWNTIIDEALNGGCKVILKDNFDRIAENTQYPVGDALFKAVEFAFEYQKQLKGWNNFLYETTLLYFKNEDIKTSQYNDEAFGSWIIELKNNWRIAFDGKDPFLYIQHLINGKWEDKKWINSSLNYSSFLEIITTVK